MAIQSNLDAAVRQENWERQFHERLRLRVGAEVKCWDGEVGRIVERDGGAYKVQREDETMWLSPEDIIESI